MENLRHQIDRDGFAVLEAILTPVQVASLCEAMTQAEETGHQEAALSRRGGSVYAVRHLLEQSEAAHQLSHSPEVRGLMESILGEPVRPVRSIFFDKTPDANWDVPWHQDLSITVQGDTPQDIPGWGPWSVKAGVPHVQPPAAFLERILTIRLHLDDCPAENGALRTLPGTHRLGRLSAERIAALRIEKAEATCAVPSGGALLMRPLVLHASSAAQLPGHRRVIHIEYAPESLVLPVGLNWHT